MKIIDDLIDQLTDNSITLTDILIKTKVLAFKLKNQELKNWIDFELNGYTEEKLPDYRVLQCQIIGQLSNGFQRATNYPIPLIALNDKQRESITTVRLNQSISTLDDFVHKGDGSKMVMNVPPEMYGFLSKNYDNGFEIEYARREIGKIQIVQLLTAVRTKLLDFLLKLNDEAGDSDDLGNLTSDYKKEMVSSLFSSSVFGNNTTIIVGDKNHQNVANSIITKDNFEELREVLLIAGIEKEDVDELEEIIKTDKPDNTKMEYGPKVKTWVTKMLGKAMDSSWKMGLGAAGKLLADGLSHYYGWK